ncbi:MAG TPA: sigma-70 family RNA polymerase sigma factor [Chryseolinea sp.]|nr:sigma-70 family RNA polymerase sigma factor [Chryseolinea sp.]
MRYIFNFITQRNSRLTVTFWPLKGVLLSKVIFLIHVVGFTDTYKMAVSAPDLIKRLLLSGNDEKALKVAYENYYSKLHKIAVGITNDTEVSKDVIQDVFINFWLKRDILKHTTHTSFEHYLVRSVKNASIDFVRRNTRGDAIMQDKIHLRESQDEHRPDAIVETNELSLNIDQAIARLPKAQRVYYVLNRKYGLTYKQIALVKGISEKAVQQSISSALKNLKRYLGY